MFPRKQSSTLIGEMLKWKQVNPKLLITAALGGDVLGTEQYTALCCDENTTRVCSVTILRAT